MSLTAQESAWGSGCFSSGMTHRQLLRVKNSIEVPNSPMEGFAYRYDGNHAGSTSTSAASLLLGGPSPTVRGRVNR